MSRRVHTESSRFSSGMGRAVGSTPIRRSWTSPWFTYNMGDFPLFNSQRIPPIIETSWEIWKLEIREISSTTSWKHFFLSLWIPSMTTSCTFVALKPRLLLARRMLARAWEHQRHCCGSPSNFVARVNPEKETVFVSLLLLFSRYFLPETMRSFSDPNLMIVNGIIPFWIKGY